MNSVIMPGLAVITIELPDGQVLSGRATKFTLEHEMQLPATSLNDDGPLNPPPIIKPAAFLLDAELGDLSVEVHTAVEERMLEVVSRDWQCPYCGSTNHADAVYCGAILGPSDKAHCGAPRPLLYGR